MSVRIYYRTAVALALTLFLAAPILAADVDPLIRGQLTQIGRADVFVKMNDQADLSRAAETADRVERRWQVHDTLVATADRSQARLREFLDGQGIQYTVFWINNSLFIEAADEELIERLATFDGVALLRGNHERPLIRPVESIPVPSAGAGIEWNIDRVNAPDVWAGGNIGEGVVVANIDTGVRWTHDALKDSYRANEDGNHHYDWWDPDLVYSEPTDNNGHGTHTMGTMVGDDGGANQIGVAPGAKWIAAQGCDSFSCSDFDLTSSAQWIACPTDTAGNNPDCSKAPDVVNNSWSGGGGDPWYQGFVNAWLAAGVVPVFSAGNSGPGCSTLGSPGDNRNNIGVASTTSGNALSSFSARGPSAFGGRRMPDISAPGSSVRSASNASDSSYVLNSGTSMSSPHVAAAIALLMSDHPGRSLVTYAKRLGQTACTSVLVAPSGSQTCGGVDWDDFPSNHYGFGLLDIGHANGDNPAPCM